MKIVSTSEKAGSLSLDDSELRESLAIIEKTSVGLYYADKEPAFFDEEDLVTDPQAIQHIWTIRNKIIMALNIQDATNLRLEYNCEKFDENSRKVQEGFREKKDPGTFEVWHQDYNEFFFCTFGDIAQLEVLHATMNVLSEKDADREHEIVEIANKIERDKPDAVLSVPDGTIWHVFPNTIHRRGLCKREGIRHAFRMMVERGSTPV